ncbi:NEDD8-activating enzyme E1 catalytic subunit [Fasciolopsis buskii]|uniref:NEDD8-activating enzyme E1 catalytic subunit n=1 Tax=Fasciolopsis buskii TaxID=27845 RepID=A0A8E0VLS8_9TREM|nr:NEDD8-activating enzyme E1 catalytic subunit [Fasciolopsis buski]
MSSVTNTSRWRSLKCLLERSGPFQRPDFHPSDELLQMLQEHVKILVVGAGGLGCELLKDLALMGFTNLDVIDMDTIDVSNLNRQFLFRPGDLGKPKAEVAAEFVMKRVPSCKVTPHFKKLQNFSEDFYRQFNLVVCGLDSVDARRWINALLASLVVYNEDGSPDPTTVIPLVDGGTEGFKGHVLVVLYGLTGCVECSLDLYPPQVNFPLCTIAHTPRLPEHCVEYTRLLLWPKEQPFGANVVIDGDSPEHIQWIYEQSLKRAQEYGISGVTLRLVQGVVKRIIPAVASTNAVIAAACATETFKLVTFCYNYLDNYMNFSDLDGIYSYVFSIERKPDCLACNNVPKHVEFAPTQTLRDVLNYLKESIEFQMKAPSITTVQNGSNKSLFIDLQEFSDVLRPNLSKTLVELGLQDGQLLQVSDVTTPRTLSFKLHLTHPSTTSSRSSK